MLLQRYYIALLLVDEVKAGHFISMPGRDYSPRPRLRLLLLDDSFCTVPRIFLQMLIDKIKMPRRFTDFSLTGDAYAPDFDFARFSAPLSRWRAMRLHICAEASAFSSSRSAAAHSSRRLQGRIINASDISHSGFRRHLQQFFTFSALRYRVDF